MQQLQTSSWQVSAVGNTVIYLLENVNKKMENYEEKPVMHLSTRWLRGLHFSCHAAKCTRWLAGVLAKRASGGRLPDLTPRTILTAISHK
jgi:hypothetical protein